LQTVTAEQPPKEAATIASVVASGDLATSPELSVAESGPAAAVTADPDEAQLPIKYIGAVFQGGTFLLLLLGACYLAAEILLPLVLALVLMLVLQPLMRVLERWHVPRGLAALGLILMLFGTLSGFGMLLSGPAISWAQKLPEGMPKLQERLRFLNKPMAAFHKLASRAEGLAPGDEGKPLAVKMEGTGLAERLISGSRNIASGLLETVLVLFFLLISGETFLRRLVEILPRFKNKRQAVDISNQIQTDISAYLVTITIMNAGVGIATGIAVAFTGLGDPLLWGTVAFLLNYVPILGPMIGVLLFLFAGLLSIDTLWLAFVPAALYLGIHMIEGETVTPMLLARRFTINPVLVIVSLVFWYWMWGVPGAILSTPMLAVTKIVCDRIQTLAAVGHFLEG
jgi:predicted PurR-regulated permease PerM